MAKPVYALVNGVWTLVGSTTAHAHTVADVTGLQAAIDAKANLASPTFTGTLTVDTVKITGGVPGAGKVLTSDADGDATWEAAAAGGIQQTIFDIKGDLLVATAADTAARLPAGTNGQILLADSAESTGLKWVDSSVITPSYSTDLGAITGGVPVTITHNLNTYDVVVQILEKNTAGAGGAAGVVTDATVAITSANAVDITFVGAAVANLYRVTVVAVGGTSGGGAAAVQTYTPALTATVTDPVIGTGGAGAGAFGRYWRSENLITAEIGICFGSSGASAGSGFYQVSLPIAQRTPTGVEGVTIGYGSVYDSSAGAWRAVSCVRLSSTLFNIYYHSANTVVTHSTPWTWAAGDQISLQLSYEAA